MESLGVRGMTVFRESPAIPPYSTGSSTPFRTQESRMADYKEILYENSVVAL